MADVDINKIRPSGNDTLEVVNRVAPNGVPRSSTRENDRYRSVGRAWRQNITDTRKDLDGPFDSDVQERMKEARRLSRPGETGVR